MPTTTFPVLIITILIFTVAFSINIWFGIFLAFWLIASITWGWYQQNNNTEGKWYDWIIGLPVLAFAFLYTICYYLGKSNDK
jgi:type II secretory pathway component PulF